LTVYGVSDEDPTSNPRGSVGCRVLRIAYSQLKGWREASARLDTLFLAAQLRALPRVQRAISPVETDDASDVDDVRIEHPKSPVTPTGAGVASQWY
jgi:hypothetical protein